MAKAKTPPHKVVMTEGKSEIIKALLSAYAIQSVQDIQEARLSRRNHQKNDGS